MTQQELEHALALTFEIEGLLMVTRERGPLTPPQVGELLAGKVTELNAMVASGGTLIIEQSPRASFATNVRTASDPVGPSRDQEVRPAQTEADPQPKTEEKPEPQKPAEPQKPVQTEPQPATTVNTAVNPRETAIRRAMPLGDKFRFKRELFGNSDRDFAETIRILATMDNPADIEDYLFNDLCWSPDNQDVRDFIALITSAI